MPKAVLNSRSPDSTQYTPLHRWEHWISFGTLMVSLVGCVVIVWSLRQTENALGWSVYANTTDWTLEVDKTFLSNPKLYPFFEDNAPIARDHKLFPKAVATADLMLDTFDSIMEQSERSPCEARREDWINWINDSFDRSPVLRDRMTQHAKMYERGKLYPIWETWCREHPKQTC